jgi:phage host-nuclease inhibitor protein Gam
MNHDPLKLFDLADRYLEQAGKLNADLKELEAQAEAELAPLRQKWEAQLAPLREQRAALDRELIALCKTARQEFFAAADLVDLRHGFLIYGRRRVVRKARGVLALLESLKWEEAIKRTAKVRWEVLEGWPEARLISCGTERVEQETFAYELKTSDQITRDVMRRGVASLGEVA